MLLGPSRFFAKIASGDEGNKTKRGREPGLSDSYEKRLAFRRGKQKTG